jgi:hypothetical protein
VCNARCKRKRNAPTLSFNDGAIENYLSIRIGVCAYCYHPQDAPLRFNQLVGIGTSSPGQKLDVNGEIVCSPNTAGKNTFQFTTLAADDASLIMRSNTTVKVNIQANGTSYFDGGNVGIGTTSPGSIFDVKPSASSSTLRIEAGTINSDSIRIQSGGTANTYLEYRGYLGHAWFVDTTERARIDSSGRLLVGTASSLLSYSKLQVQGGAGVDPGAHICLSNENSAPSSGSNIGSVRFTNNAGGIGAILGCEADGAWTAGMTTEAA